MFVQTPAPQVILTGWEETVVVPTVVDIGCWVGVEPIGSEIYS